MKLTTLFTIVVFFIVLVGIIMAAGNSIYSANKALKEHTQEHLEHIVKLKTEQIKFFLEAKKARAVDFASDGLIKNSLIELKQGANFEEISEELENHLTVNKILVEENIYEIYILDADGNEIAETVHEGHEEEHEEVGSFYNDSLYLEGKNRAYAKGIFYDYEFERIGVAFSAPILFNNEFLGVVIIKLIPEGLKKITTDRAGFKETEEVYIVNKEGYMTTPSRFLGDEGGTLVQKVDTENSKNCFEGVEMFGSDIEKLEKHERENFISFLNYRGEDVFGVHKHLLEIDSCVLVEIDKKEVLAPLKRYIKNQIIISTLVFIILSLIGFFIGRFLDKKYSLKRKKGEK